MHRYPVVGLCLALLAATLPGTVARAAAPQWNTLQAPHCLVVSQRPERETRAWATQFEQFVLTLREVLQFEEAALPPLTVVLFANDSRFGAYRPLDAKGRKRNVAGFFASRDTWSVISLAGGFVDEPTRRIVLHEATHWMGSAMPSELPLWLDEGFAEVFSAFEVRQDHILLGQPIDYHVATLGRSGWAPLLQLMLTGHHDRLYTDSERNPFFYAESWLFVHRLLFHDRKAGYAALNRFFEARRHGTDQIAAFRLAFGRDPEDFDDELHDYVRHGSFHFSKLPLPAGTAVSAPFRPATPHEVEIALARVASGAGLTELARRHIDQALALDPTQPAAHELLALHEWQAQNQPAARSAAQAALERGSRDAWMHILAAEALWARSADRGEVAERSREIAALYTTAAQLQPGLRAPYLAYARLVHSFPTATQADATFLGAGYARFPDEIPLLIGVAVVLQKGHNTDEATKMLEAAIARGDRLTAEQRSDAERLRIQWRIEPLARRIDVLVKDRDFATALALCKQILEQPMRYEDHRFWEGRRSDLRFQTALLEAQSTIARDGLEAGIARLEGLLADPGLNATQQSAVERLLGKLRQRR